MIFQDFSDTNNRLLFFAICIEFTEIFPFSSFVLLLFVCSRLLKYLADLFQSDVLFLWCTVGFKNGLHAIDTMRCDCNLVAFIQVQTNELQNEIRLLNPFISLCLFNFVTFQFLQIFGNFYALIVNTVEIAM